MFQYVPICSNMFQYVPICSNIFQYQLNSSQLSTALLLSLRRVPHWPSHREATTCRPYPHGHLAGHGSNGPRSGRAAAQVTLFSARQPPRTPSSRSTNGSWAGKSPKHHFRGIRYPLGYPLVNVNKKLLKMAH